MTSARVLLTALHLLDHQLVDADGTYVGKVDDAEICVLADGSAHLVALLSGPGVLASRLGRRRYGGWRERMEHDLDGPSGRTARITMGGVRSIEATIRLNLRAQQVAPYGSERWVADHLIGRIPGSGHRPSEGPDLPASSPAPEQWRPPSGKGLEHVDPDSIRASSLLGRDVTDQEGRRMGIVLDVRLLQDGPVGAAASARLRVDGLVVGHGRFPQRSGLLRHVVHGPWLLRTVADRLGPDRRYLLWNDVRNPRGLLQGEPVEARGPSGPLPS